MPPNTQGIRKCSARILTVPRRKHKVAVLNEKRARPCGRKAVVSYKLRHKWGDQYVCMCEKHDPQSEDIFVVKKTLGGDLSKRWSPFRTVTFAERLDYIIPTDNVQKKRAVARLIRIMGQANASKMNEDDWREVLEEALREYSTKRVVEG